MYKTKFYYNSILIAGLFFFGIFYIFFFVLGLILLFLKYKYEKKAYPFYEKYKEIEDLENYINTSKKEKEKLTKELEEAKSVLNSYENDLTFSEYGIYKPIFDFKTPQAYKSNIENIQLKQKVLIEQDEACTYGDFQLNGSSSQGKKLIKDNIKQILRSFNNECDVLNTKVKYNNINAMISRMQTSYNQLNKLNQMMSIMITPEYLDLKILELKAYFEYECKKQEEKEKAREEKERLREEAKLLKELEEKRKIINKEKNHYKNALSDIEDLLKDEPENKELLIKKSEIEFKIEEIEKNLKDIDYREANKKAGYVYIISNIGAFGENVYKIGMTRRLEPMDRINELGDASVPFNFDVHAMIFSDDAPKLENALHHAFEDKKMNMINHRREFFRVSLEEIEKVVKENYDKTVNFIKIPEAEQYRESLKIYETNKATDIKTL